MQDQGGGPPKPAETAAGLGRGMPSDPLLEMLRNRIIPVARDCFRRDRAGRADYAVRAVFHFELAEQEVVDARVEGAIESRLRECLISAVDTLLVPRFTGIVRVSYPLRTLREALPVRLELSDVAAREVDQLIAP